MEAAACSGFVVSKEGIESLVKGIETTASPALSQPAGPAQARPSASTRRSAPSACGSWTRREGRSGSWPTSEALEFANSKGLDLVEVAAGADPPVARVMDYSKYRYEQEQRAKQARKHQLQIHIKEIKLRPKIGIHDYETKKGHVVRF